MSKQRIFLYLSLFFMLLVMLFIVFGDKGLLEYWHLKAERNRLMEKNDRLKKDNLLLYKEIERLKTDPDYLENVARKEYKMVGRDEVVVELQGASGKNQ